MKEIIIKDSNRERIEQAIKEAEGRAKERTIIYKDIVDAIKAIEKKFSFATKKSMDGLKVMVDMNAQTYPKAYKYQPQATFFGIRYSKGSWRLICVERENQSKTKITRYEIWYLPSALKDAIMNQYTAF